MPVNSKQCAWIRVRFPLEAASPLPGDSHCGDLKAGGPREPRPVPSAGVTAERGCSARRRREAPRTAACTPTSDALSRVRRANSSDCWAAREGSLSQGQPRARRELAHPVWPAVSRLGNRGRHPPGFCRGGRAEAEQGGRRKGETRGPVFHVRFFPLGLSRLRGLSRIWGGVGG